MVPADLEPVMAVERRAFKHPWSEELFRRELEHEWSTILVAEKPGPCIVGFIIYWSVHDELHILNVATEPAERRQGIARCLLTECVARGRTKGAALATLEVRKSNVAAIKLYETFGFRSVGIRPNYYADEGEDAIVMLMDL
ncbi:MAG: ribosomal protein S18-alanine N-acetyltransferase [Deltaproteobacteria bacterium]|nr:ribosomal protein S18-alanine N-acetyltransferase [Deltaproteobacteria bacterium]